MTKLQKKIAQLRKSSANSLIDIYIQLNHKHNCADITFSVPSGRTVMKSVRRGDGRPVQKDELSALLFLNYLATLGDRITYDGIDDPGRPSPQGTLGLATKAA